MIHRTLRVSAALAAAFAFHSARAQQPAAPAPGDTLQVTLKDALDRALAGGDEVRLAESRRDAANAQIGMARSTGLPQLRMSTAFTHVYENARAQAVGQIFNQPNTYNVNFNLSMPLFQGGRVSAGLRGANRTRGAALADVEQARADVTVSVLSAYLDALLAQQLVDIQRDQVRLADERVRQMEQMERAGRASRYDVLRARVERSNLEPAAIQAEGDRELALLEVKRLANLPAEQPLKLVSAVSPDEVAALAQGAGAGSASADSAIVASIPSVRAAELRAQASRTGISVAKADYLPTVSLFVTSGWQAFPTDWSLPTSRGGLSPIPCSDGATDRVCTQQNGGWFSDRSAGLQVSWPVFDGLRARSNVALARAQAEVAQAQAAQAREAAAVQLARARSNLARAQAQFAATRQNSSEAAEAFRLASLRFSRGLSTQLDVSDAQLALATARTNEARATYDLYLATAELARAQGRAVPLPAAEAPTTR